MAEIRALLPDGTAPSTLKAQIQAEATNAAAAVGEQLAEGIQDAASYAITADQKATEAQAAVEAMQASLSSETIRIFPTQAEAQAWEAEQEGRIGLWVDQGEPLTEVTAAAPTFNDSTNTYSIPTSEGVDYYVEDGIVTGTRSVGDVDTTVLVSAVPRDGYTIVGTNAWEGTFTKAATAPVQVTATAPTFDDAADTYTIPVKTGVRYLVGGTVRTGTVPVGDVDTTVTVTAQAESGYALTGTTSWTGTYTKKATAPASWTALHDMIVADSPHYYLPLEGGSLTDIGSAPRTWTSTEATAGAWGTTLNRAGGITCPSASSQGLLGGLSAFTVEMVVDPLNLADGDFLLTDVKNSDYVLSAGSNGFSMKLYSGTSATSTVATSPAGSYIADPQHVAVTLADGVLRIYRDGVEVGQKAYAPPTRSVDAQIGVGTVLDGQIGRFALYRGKALTAARILEHAQAVPV